MRVPIPVVILLCLGVIAGVWWQGTRHMDFLTPPGPEKLALIRTKVESSMPRPAERPHIPDALPVPPPPAPEPPPEPPKPPIDPGDLSSPPTLAEYSQQAEQGATHLIELAALLETKGEFQRALLAWERVIDTARSDTNDTLTALGAIKRLRPTLADWNSDASKAVPIVLQAGTGKKTAKSLTALLDATAREIERASSGLLKVTTLVTAGKDPKPANGPAPVALWLTGPGKKARSTEVLSFTIGTPETLRDEMEKTVFTIIRTYLGRGTKQTAPPNFSDGQPVREALQFHITRLRWQQLGTMLNLPPEKEP